MQENQAKLNELIEDYPDKYQKMLMEIEERAARSVMQDYFDNDQLNLLPKTII